MKRVALTIAALLLVVVAVVGLPFVFRGNGSASATAESTSITDYRADFSLARDGDLAVTETVTVDFTTADKHGIYRFWDIRDPSDSHARLVPHDITVTKDGEPEFFTVASRSRGRYRVAQIGQEAVLLAPGDHTYVISYRIDGVIDPDDRADTGVAAPSMFYWNLIPSGWQQTIDKAELTVHLPVAAPDQVNCAVGSGASGGCTVAGTGTRDLSVTTGAIPALTPVTIATALDLPTPSTGRTLPWTQRWDPVLGQHVSVLIAVIVLAVLAFALGSVLAARSREKAPAFPVLYAPPEGLGPAQAAYLYQERVDNQTYVATLMWAAEKGAIGLKRDDRTWTVTDTSGTRGWAGLDPVTVGIAHLLSGPGTSFVAAPSDADAGRRLKSEISTFESRTKTWGQTSGTMTSSGISGLGGLLVVAGFILALAIGIWYPFGLSVLGLIPGAFSAGGLSLASRGAGTRRTPSGRDLWSQVGGFRRILATDSSEARFEFAARQDLYTTYLPWAVALGCADEWAEKYRTEMATEPPVPRYFDGYYGGVLTGSLVSSMVDSFDSTVSSAISSYDETQSSSSSGGGGFSGGGGGGGGGGGSW